MDTFASQGPRCTAPVGGSAALRLPSLRAAPGNGDRRAQQEQDGSAGAGRGSPASWRAQGGEWFSSSPLLSLNFLSGLH